MSIHNAGRGSRVSGWVGLVSRGGVLVMLACGFAMTPPAFAEVDLVSAWEGAQARDPTFASARAQVQAGDARGRQAQALMLPTVTLSGSGGFATVRQDTSGAQFTGPGFGTVNGVDFRTDITNGTATGWRITAQQPLWNAELRANARQLELGQDLTGLQMSAARQDLIIRTAQAYFGVLAAEDEVIEVRQLMAATARALEVASANYDEGRAPVTDRDEAQARFDEAVAREFLAQNELALRCAAFVDLTGLPGDALKRIPPDGTLNGFDAGRLERWLELANAQSPQVAMQQRAGDIARQEVDKFTALGSPTVALVAQAGGDRLAGDSAYGGSGRTTSNTSSILLQVSVPLFTGGMRSAKQDEAIALAEKARFDTEATRLAVAQQARAAWLGVTSSQARIRARERSLASSRSRLEATETGREVGARTTLDLVNAQADQLRAQRELLLAKYQALVDRNLLARAAGELSETHLRALNANLAASASGERPPAPAFGGARATE